MWLRKFFIKNFFESVPFFYKQTNKKTVSSKVEYMEGVMDFPFLIFTHSNPILLVIFAETFVTKWYLASDVFHWINYIF